MSGEELLTPSLYSQVLQVLSGGDEIVIPSHALKAADRTALLQRRSGTGAEKGKHNKRKPFPVLEAMSSAKARIALRAGGSWVVQSLAIRHRWILSFL